MTNQEVANLLRQIAKILEIKGDSTFRIRAYEEAATRVENLAEPIEDIWKRGELTNVPGIGESIAAKIEEYLKTGKSSYLEEISKDIPKGLLEPLTVYRVGQGISSSKWKSASWRWNIYRNELRMSVIESAWYYLSYVVHGALKFGKFRLKRQNLKAEGSKILTLDDLMSKQ